MHKLQATARSYELGRGSLTLLGIREWASAGVNVLLQAALDKAEIVPL